MDQNLDKYLYWPVTNEEIVFSKENNSYVTISGSRLFPICNNVISFLEKTDNFYEGSYLNRVKFNPKNNNVLGTFPLWVINGGYMHTVKREFKPGSVLLELGCASGVDYFGARYNMIGLDVSLKSLQGLCNYKLSIQADATVIPLANQSIDGIISSYFWEHIPPLTKDKMLTEFKRVLKPGGKLVFLYDVETDNNYISLLKKKDNALYNKLFLEGDGHFGYETPAVNKKRFMAYDFILKKHFGMERSALQSNSVYEKYRHLNGILGLTGRVGFFLTSGKLFNYASILFIRLFDETLGRLWPISKSRIIITVANLKK
jgi:SAM-dependent methyltransferase